MGALDCSRCHTLVHGAELDELAKQANALEGKGDLAQARELWCRSLTKLPPESKQAAWVKEKLSSLEAEIESGAPKPNADHTWARRLGPLAPLAILLAKGKGLFLIIFKLKFLFSFLSFFAVYAGLFGWRYGLGLAVSILIHELGHYIDIKRRGLPAEMPVFLPGLGAYVRWTALGVTQSQIAQISLAGPLAGVIAAAGCYWMYLRTTDPLWAALARTGAILNTLNLIPVWMLDGGKAANALGRSERIGLLVVVLLLWVYTGQGIFFLVAAGTVFRLFTKDVPPASDWNSLVYYAAVLGALAYVLHLVPAGG